MKHPYLMLVQGGPGVGKTTIAKRLSKDLGIDCFSKDSFKEMLYDTIGMPQTTESTKIYGRIAIRAMYAAADEYIKAGKSVMIEAPVEERFAKDELASIIASDAIMQVHVQCDPEVQVQRFGERIETGERHKGHIPTPITIEDARASQARHAPLSDLLTISVDTTDFSDNDYDALLTSLKEELI